MTEKKNWCGLDGKVPEEPKISVFNSVEDIVDTRDLFLVTLSPFPVSRTLEGKRSHSNYTRLYSN